MVRNTGGIRCKMCSMISVPLKKTVEVDLEKPLKSIFARIYSIADKPADLSTAISETNKLRLKALSKTIEISMAGLELLCNYYDQILALETKLATHEVNIPFKWKCAFSKSGLFMDRAKASLSVSSLAYEKVCVLFNIAAIQSQVAAAAVRFSNTDENIKKAAKLFQQAAGIFAHLKTAASALTLGGQKLTTDLTPDCVSALSALMLAQAQQLFVKKAVQDTTRDRVIAKLCVQAEAMYRGALQHLQKQSVKHLWDREWIPTVSGKQIAFAALSQYFQSQDCAEQKKVGEQIARLNYCLELLKQAQRRSDLPNFFDEYVKKANRLLEEAKKDNHHIYNEIIPETSKLLPIDKVENARLAKATPVAERLSSGFNAYTFS